MDLFNMFNVVGNERLFLCIALNICKEKININIYLRL